MSHGGLRQGALSFLAIATLLAGGQGLGLDAGLAGARTAVVKTGNLVLRADGAFEPRSLPRHRFAAIAFQGHVDIAARDGGVPAALLRAVVGFDRDGRLQVGGLPVCPPELIAAASTEEARSICRGAVVGSGHVDAVISLAGGPVPTSSPLTLFNGPREDGHPTVVLHARTTVPATQTYAIVIPIERQRGEFRYRATLDVPPIAGGLGAITHIDVDVGRRFRAGGRVRSYVSAHCSDGILRTFGAFDFDDGTVIEGAVEKFCHAR